MRISGRGFFGGGSAKGRQRAGEFTRRHRVGERVSGRVLKRERPGYAWVDFEGIELLANIQSDPEPGQRLLFEVMRLEPDILLQELAVARAQGDPLGPAIDLFWAARTRFESAASPLRAELAALPGPEAPRREAFAARLAAAPELARAFATVSEAAAAINEIISPRDGGTLDYRPWLIPEALSGEMLTLTRHRQGAAPVLETGFSFLLPPHGQCELRLMASGNDRTARLFLEQTGLAPAFEKLLRTYVFKDEVQFFSPAPLPREARAGVLAPLLGAGRGRPRFARRV